MPIKANNQYTPGIFGMNGDLPGCLLAFVKARFMQKFEFYAN